MPPVFKFNVFSLPEDLIENLKLRNLLVQHSARSPSPTADPDLIQVLPFASGGRACNICLGATFIDVDAQRIHYRSDWHRYNVKTRLRGGKPVTEPAFVQLMESLEDSLSGSASSSDESDSDSDKIATLLDSSGPIARTPSPTEKRTLPQTPLAWFHSPPSTQIGVYKALFPAAIPLASYLDELRAMQQTTEDGRKWAIFMTAGGHFAGAIIRVGQSQVENKKSQRLKSDTEVLRHKTFHRYTTRRKQGGSQSMNDNAKGPAKSAGAQLRRYGEQALRDDIRTLLTEWAEDIRDCERIWIRASTSNRRIFLDYDDALMTRSDPRLRTFPFPTRRPTQSELARCLLELTKVKITNFTEEELRAQDEAWLASLPKPKPAPSLPAVEPEKPKQPKLSKEEEALRAKWIRLIEMVSKGRLESLKAFWEREGSNLGGVNIALPDWTGETTATLLQLAAQAGQEAVTQWLLEEQRADPQIEVPQKAIPNNDSDTEHASETVDGPSARVAISSKTAYDLARTKEVRNVFRRCAAAHPDWWDWFGAARVPSALSKAMEEDRGEKRKVRLKGLREKMKEREAKEKEKTTLTPPEIVEATPLKSEEKHINPTAPRKLGGAAGAADALIGLTPEMQMRLERERRARAAEARLKALSGG